MSNTRNYGDRCRHIFDDGAQCGSPALSEEKFCYYHHETRKPVANPRQRQARRNTFHMPAPTNRSNIQGSLSEIFIRIASNEIDLRRAGLLLYCLQIAATNLKAQPTKPVTEEIPEQAGNKPDQQDGEDEQEEYDEPTTCSRSVIHRPADPVRGRPISRGVFGALLEQLAKHNGIDIEDPALRLPCRLSHPRQPQGHRRPTPHNVISTGAQRSGETPVFRRCRVPSAPSSPRSYRG